MSQTINTTSSQKEEWENDELCLELNWNNCLNEGRHEDTSDEDWALFYEALEKPYSEEMYNRLKTRLEEREPCKCD